MLKKLINNFKSSISYFIHFILETEALPALIIFFILTPLILILDFSNIPKKGFGGSILATMNALPLEILFFGFIFAIYRREKEKSIELDKLLGQIKYYRYIETQEAKESILGILQQLPQTRTKLLDLSNCYLEGAILYHYPLNKVIFDHANLEKAHFPSIRDSSFQNARLSNSQLSDISFYKCNFTYANLNGIFTPCPDEIKFIKCIFSHAQMNKTYFWHGSISYSVLNNVHFDNSKLLMMNLNNNDFSNSVFNGATISGSSFISSILKSVDFRNSTIKEYFEEMSHGPDIHSITKFSNANLEKANMSGLDFKGVDFSGSSLIEANLQHSINLIKDQLLKAKTLYNAEIDPDLKELINQECPSLFEKPEGYDQRN